MTRQREAAKFKAPVTEERDRQAALAQTPPLPGLEVPAVKNVMSRSDDIWRMVRGLLEFALQQAGYESDPFIKTGMLCTSPTNEDILIVCHWQREAGGFDNKIPKEVARLSAMSSFDRAYVVLAGPGFNKEKKQRWLAGELDTSRVRVVDLDFFLAAVYCRKL